MQKPSILRDEKQQLRKPLRFVWNGTERRVRLPIRLVGAFVLFVVLAGAGNQFRPTLLSGNGPLTVTVNMIGRQLPNAVGLTFAVVVAALVLDRRRLIDLGLRIDQGWWRGLAGGTALGAGITLLAVVTGLLVGYYEFNGFASPQILSWVLIGTGGAIYQLTFVIPEELFVRGYLITNITEGVDGVQRVPRWIAAGIGVLAASILFYLTHAAGKGVTFGLMAGGLSLLLGLGYVVSGDLSVPIGVHFGFNFAGVLVGTNSQPASLLAITSRTTVQESIALPLESVVVRLLGAVIGIGLLLWWYYSVRGQLQVDPRIPRATLHWNTADEASET